MKKNILILITIILFQNDTFAFKYAYMINNGVVDYNRPGSSVVLNQDNYFTIYIVPNYKGKLVLSLGNYIGNLYNVIENNTTQTRITTRTPVICNYLGTDILEKRFTGCKCSSTVSSLNCHADCRENQVILSNIPSVYDPVNTPFLNSEIIINTPETEKFYTISWTWTQKVIDLQGERIITTNFTSTCKIVPTKITIKLFKENPSTIPLTNLSLIDQTEGFDNGINKYAFKIAADETNSIFVVTSKGGYKINSQSIYLGNIYFDIVKTLLYDGLDSVVYRVSIKKSSSSRIPTNLIVCRVSSSDSRLDRFDYNFDINVLKPPVLFVHGLNSNANDAFGVMESFFASSGTYLSSQLHSVNYPLTNKSEFVRNANVVPDGIDYLLSKAIKDKISVGKVDIVGHSMGGILARLYLQSILYKNDIARLITINTPHSGSQWADLITDNTINNLLDFSEGIIDKSNTNDFGALGDLRVNSSSIDVVLNGVGNLNRNIVPTHVITTTYTPPLYDFTLSSYNPLGLPLIPISEPLAKIMSFAISTSVSSFTSKVFKNQQHDLVVSLPSQNGGIPDNSSRYNTNFTNQPHLGSTSNQAVILRTYNLLNSNENEFTKNGFNPPNLTYISGSRMQTINNTNSSSIRIDYPLNNSIYKKGDQFDVSVTGNDLVEIYTFAEYKQDSVLALRVSGNRLIFRINVNNNFYNGEHDIWIFGKTVTNTLIKLNQKFKIQSLDCESLKSGNWNDSFSWNCSEVPTEYHNVNIKTGHKIQLLPTMGIQKCKRLTVQFKGIFENSGILLISLP